MAATESHQISRGVGILIPTRNRPDKVLKLLDSLAGSSVKPTQVVIVSSGSDISHVVSEFVSKLTIRYLHTDVSGQANQKKLGCRLLDEDLEWVVFLDDDLVVSTSCIQTAIQEAESFENDSKLRVLGVGLALPPTTRVTKENGFTKLLGEIFGISNSIPGAVFKNGHAASYLECKEVTSTQWLNGASMWRRELVTNYGKNLISTKYAACEDLIFSYPLNLKGKLIYVPAARVDFQDDELTNFENFSVFKTAALWRLYFVSTNPGFSLPFFLFTQLGRNLFGAFKTKESPLKFFLNASALWLELLYLSSRKSRIENTLRNL